MSNIIKRLFGKIYEGNFLVGDFKQFRAKLGKPEEVTHTIYTTPDTFISPVHWNGENTVITPIGQSFILCGEDGKIELGDILNVKLGQYASLPSEGYGRVANLTNGEIGRAWKRYTGQKSAKAPGLVSYRIIEPNIAKKEHHLVDNYDELAHELIMKQVRRICPRGHKLGSYYQTVFRERLENMKNGIRINTRTKEELVDKIKELKIELKW